MKSILNSTRARVPSRCLEVAVLILTAMVLTACAAARPVLRASDESVCVTVNNLESSGTPVASNRKVIVVNFVFRETGVESQVPVVTFGRGQTPASQGCNFQFVLVGTQDEVLAQFGIWDPRTQISDEQPTTGFIVAKQAAYAARFPFSSRVKEIRLFDSRREQVRVVDLTGALKTFCLEHPSESECKDFLK